MSNKILHKRNNVAGQEPLADQIDLGEIAINTADGKMFIKKSDGTIQDVSKEIFKGDTRVVVNDEGNGVVTMEIDGVEKLRVDGSQVSISDDLEIDNQGAIKLKELDAFGDNSINIKSPAELSDSYDIVLPATDAKKGQILQNLGFGETKWSDPGSLGGNRIYVSAEYGDDLNDGRTGSVKTIKRAAQIASDGIFTPIVDPGQSARDAKDLIETNRAFLQNEVVQFSTDAFNVTYDAVKCERDVGLIVDAIENDLRLGGDSASSVAGAFYSLESSALVKQAQDVATEYGLKRIQSIVKDVVTNTVVTETTQVGAVQQFDGTKTATASEAVLVNNLGQVVVDFYVDGVGTIPNEVKTTDTGYLNAEILIDNNKTFIQDEVIAFLNQKYSGFAFNEAKCSRDTGLLVEAANFDVLYGGNAESHYAGLTYLNATASEVRDSQKTETLAGIDYARTLSKKVVLGETAKYTYQTSILQNTALTAGTQSEANAVQARFDIIYSLLNSGIGTANGVITTNTAILNSSTLIESNYDFIKEEVIGYLAATYPSFSYDQNKCRRDVGLILDAVRYDLTHGGNNESIQSALSYYRWVASTAINEQLGQTLAGIDYALDLATLAVVNQAPAISYQATFTQVTDTGNAGDANSQTIITGLNTLIADIITDGDSASIGLDIDPNNAVPSTVTDVVNANAILAANKAFIEAETVAFIKETFGNFSYDPVACSRDVGLIVDAVKFDVEHGGDAESIFAGISYYNNVSAGTGEISGDAVEVLRVQLQPTIDALEYTRDLLTKVVMQSTIANPYQTVTTQTLDGANPSTNGVANTVYSRANTVVTILKNGLGVTNSFTKTTNVPALNAEALLQSNTAFIQEEVVAFTSDQYPGFSYDQASCKRDVALILDAVEYDLTHGGNTNTIAAGVAYYKQAAALVVSGQRTETLAGLNHLKLLITEVVRNVTVDPTYSVLSQTFDGANPSDTTSANTLGGLLDIIIDIVDDGLSSVVNVTANGAITTDQDILDAGALITSNKAFIQDETVAYVDASWVNFSSGYNQNLCRRDTGYILDALNFDLTWGGNSNSVTSAIAYFKQSSAFALQRQLVQTVDGIMHAVKLAQQVVENYDVTSWQIGSTQTTDTLNPGSQAAVTKIAELGVVIEDIITDGVSAEAGISISRNTIIPTTDVNVTNAADLVALNKAFIQAEVVSYINTNFTNFDYDVEFCRRDVGLFIDAITYDLIFGGNSRALEAGDAYFIGATSVIQGQEFQTILANQYFAKLVDNILKNIVNTRLYQNITGQTVDLAKVVDGTTRGIVESEFNIIVDIIENGAASPNRPTKVDPAFNIAYTTIMISTGEYKEDNPVIIPDYVSIVGDNLRTCIVRPLNANQDIFRVRNGCYLLGITFKDGLDAYNVPSFTGNYCAAFDDPFDTGVDRTGYFGLRDRPLITQSPYVQNVSIISFLGLNGCLVDGSKVITPNAPRFAIEAENPVFGETPEQGKSMVANAFTMLSFGGIGWRLTNDAYAQIVSCFQIFLGNGCWCQSGAYLSVTNSATNFGLYALRSSGYSANTFVFDRGVIAEAGAQASQQKLTTVGTKRTPINQFVIRLYDDDEFNNLANDITNNFKTVPSTVQFNAGEIGTLYGDAASYVVNTVTADTFTIQVGPGKNLGSYTSGGTVDINQAGAPVAVVAATYDNVAGTLEIDIDTLPVVLDNVTITELTFSGTNYPIYAEGALDLDANTITISGHGFVTGDAVTYRRAGNVEVNGLADQGLYYVEVLTNDIIRLYQDDSRGFVADLISISSGLHTLETQTEEFFIDDIILDADGNAQTHNKYQILTLQPGSYAFNPGDTIEATTGIYRNKAFVYAYDSAARQLTVSVEKAENLGSLTRIFFDATSIIDADSAAIPNSNILVTGFGSRTDLFTTTFTIDPTIVGGVFTSTGNLPGTYIRFHRPSIVNSSSHTWEYAGSGTDYNALPQNGGITRGEFEQFNDLPGRVYSSGTNELGDFKVGDFIVAENRTGNITFKNTVTVGELSALKLAVSDVVIEAISVDPGLGDNEPGGASDTRLITQNAARSFLANRLGDFIDKSVSTNSVSGAVPQMNAQGLLNADIIPATRNFSLYVSNKKYGRFNLTNDVPPQEPLQGDIAQEKYERRFFTLSEPVTFTEGDVIVEANTGATGVVDESNGGATTVYFANIEDTFSTNISANTLSINGTNSTAYVTNTGSAEVRDIQYTMVQDSSSQFLKYTPGGATFTPGSVITAANSKTQGTVVSTIDGVALAVDIANISNGAGYNPTTGSLVYEGVSLTSTTGTGTGAKADITVANGLVTNVDLTLGGSGYAVGDALSADASDLGGQNTTDFAINVIGIDNRVFVNLIAGKFVATSTLNDYIEDLTAPVVSVALGNTTLTAFNADTISNSGNVDYPNSRITINSHIFDNGDVVNYASSPNPAIGGLLQGESYFVKVLDANTVELYNRYDLDVSQKVTFTSSSTGTHAFIIKHVDTRKDRIYAPDHGFTNGQAFRFVSANPPTGMADQGYYYVGTPSVNTFSVHVFRADALASINGVTAAPINFVQTGSGSADFVAQNITVFGEVNTSSNLEVNWALTGSANVDATNIVSGVISTSRLAAVGTANSNTYLKGDSSWDFAVRTVRIALDSPLSITGDFYTSGGQNFYYKDGQFDIDRADDTLGNQSFTNLGVSAFSKAQFNVNSGEVELKAGVLDAGTLDGLDSQYFLDPGNLLNPVPVSRGGTAIDQYIPGDMIYATSASTLNRLPIGGQGAVMVVDELGNPAWSNDVAPFIEDTNNAGVSRPLEIRHEVTNTPATGIGVGMQFQVETANNNREVGGTIDAAATDVTFGSEDFSFKFNLMAAGFLTERAVLDSRGNFEIDGDFTVGGGDIKATSTSASLYDTTVSSLTIGRSASSITIGSDKTGELRIRNKTLVVGGDAVETAPVDAVIKAPNGLGTNKQGPDLSIQGGASTGNGVAGSVFIDTGATGNSGSTSNTQVNRVEIRGSTAHTPELLLGRASQSTQQVGTVGVKGPITGQFNINGAKLDLKPGAGTGSGNGASVNIYGSDSIGSGSGIQVSELIASFDGDAIRLNKDVITQASSLGTNQLSFDLLNTTVTTLNIAGAATAIDIGASSGYLHVNSADQATSTTTGALRVDGGGSFGKSLYVGGQLVASGLTLTGAIDGNSYNVSGNEVIDDNRRFISSGGTTGELAKVHGISFDWDGNYGNLGGYTNHGISSRGETWGAGDDISINSYHNVNVRLDTNSNNSASTTFFRINNDVSQTNGNIIFSARGDGKIGINKDASGTYNLDVNGSFNATTGYVNGGAIWTETNDGAGSGLNADLLDGLHADSFLRVDTGAAFSGGVFKISAPATTIQNTGEVNTLQLYQGNGANVYDAFMTFHIGGDYAVHFGLDGTTNDLAYGGWSAGAVAHRVWHAGNDGSGSGLDADLLDGQDSAFFRNASNLNAGTFPDRFDNGTRYNIGFIDGFGGNSYDKLRVWDSGSYSIGMHSGQTMGWLNDYAMTFTMNNDTDRGFKWRHESDGVAAGAMALTTDGRLTVKQFISVGNQTTRYLREPTGNYGSIQVSGSGFGDWEGFSIDGRAVFMHNGGTETGLFNDVNNEWLFRADHNGRSGLYHDGSEKINTRSNGGEINGELYVANWVRIESNSGIYWEGGNYAGWHIYPQATNRIHMRSANSGSCEISLANSSNTIYGRLYADDASQGFLNEDGNWSLRSYNNDGVSPGIRFYETGGNTSWTGNPGNDIGKIEYHADRMYIVAGANSNRVCQFRRDGSDVSYVDNSGTYQGTAASANWADLAEKYLADEVYPFGTVLAIGGDAEVTLFKPGMKLAGVVSTQPGLMMNQTDENRDDPMWPFVALKGRVPVLINGSATKGQYIIADQDGKGRAVDELSTIAEYTMLIGIALEDGTDEVEVKV